MRLHRVGNWAYRHGVPLLPQLAKGLIRLLWNCVLPSEAVVGSDTALGYRGLGTVVHARARVGHSCLIGPNVTIGGRSGHHDVPVIGDRVLVGAGARILGPVSVGDGAIVGANAVVIADVPAKSIVAGVPGRIIKRGVNVDEYATMPGSGE